MQRDNFKIMKNGLILEQLLLGNFQIAESILFSLVSHIIDTQPRQDPELRTITLGNVHNAPIF